MRTDRRTDMTTLIVAFRNLWTLLKTVCLGQITVFIFTVCVQLIHNIKEKLYKYIKHFYICVFICFIRQVLQKRELKWQKLPFCSYACCRANGLMNSSFEIFFGLQIRCIIWLRMPLCYDELIYCGCSDRRKLYNDTNICWNMVLCFLSRPRKINLCSGCIYWGKLTLKYFSIQRILYFYSHKNS